MRLFVSPRFTLSLSGTHALRSLLRSLRHVLPSEGVAVSVSHYCIARGKAHTGPGDKHTRAGNSSPAGGEESFGLFWVIRLHDDFIERVLVSLFLILTLLN